MVPERSWVLLDACCWINLLATDRTVEILRALPWSLGVADRVVNEVKGLDALTAQGILTRLALAPRPEVATFVRLAAELEDGEAATGALAFHRGAAVATDDRKAIRVFGGLTPPIAVVQTPQLLWQWATAAEPGAAEVRAALQAIETHARFRPRSGVPYAEWWRTAALAPG